MMRLPKYLNRILVTGGSGFIGGTLIKKLIKNTKLKVFNLDKSGYASNLEINNQFSDKSNYEFLKVNLSNFEDTKRAIKFADPDIVFHLAAESHVDRSIENPQAFLETNILGTAALLDAAKNSWLDSNDNSSSDSNEITKSNLAKNKIFYHISTDEVYGSLGNEG